MDKICVAVRVRPSISQDPFNGTYWKVEDNRVSLQKTFGTPIHGNSYAFDHVFDENCSNARVYELLASDIIHAAVEGFNGTAFAYGQTSSGKTFTMNGSQTNPGIVLLAIKDIFEKIHRIIDREFLIRISYMEIYNEEIIDLLAIENQKLQIKESLDRGVFVAGLKEEIVNDADQVLKLIELGEVNRHFGETNMNVRSSRSHTIFRMVIESHAKDNNFISDSLTSDAVRVSVLNLVDLAGSERIAKTGAGGVRLKEGKYINKSLLILGNVINKLSEGAKLKGHIPYRDSKLTRILQPALGGNAKTSIICTIAPEEIHVEETKGTLLFASRAKRITNCAKVNEILTDAALLKRQKLEIEELRQKLQGSHSGVQELEILKLRNEMLKYEVEREMLELKLEEERKSHQEERDQYIKEQQIKIDSLKNLVTSSECEKYTIEGCMGSKESINSQTICEENVFTTPFKVVPSSFISKRADHSILFACSPLPGESSTVADEDTWFRMNKGCKTNLDLLQMTPAEENVSFPTTDTNPECLIESEKDEIHYLRKQIQQALEDKIEIERNHKEQMVCNNRLLDEISDLQNEVTLMHRLPERLREFMITSKDICNGVLSCMENLVNHGNSSTARLLSSTREISSSLFSSLETQFSEAMENDKTSSSGNNTFIQEETKLLCERLSTTSSLLLSEVSTPMNSNVLRSSLCQCRDKGCSLGGENCCWREEMETMNADLKKELDLKTHFLEDAKESCRLLERDSEVLKQDRDSLHLSLSQSLQDLSIAVDEKQKVLSELGSENKKRTRLEEEIRQFCDVFSGNQRSMMSYNSGLISQIQKIRAQTLKSPVKTLA